MAAGLRGEDGGNGAEEGAAGYGHAFRVIPIAVSVTRVLSRTSDDDLSQQLRQVIVYVAKIVGDQGFESHGGASADDAFVR